jgi:hypothetical protein
MTSETPDTPEPCRREEAAYRRGCDDGARRMLEGMAEARREAADTSGPHRIGEKPRVCGTCERHARAKNDARPWPYTSDRSDTPSTEALTPMTDEGSALLAELAESPLPGARYAYDVVARRLPDIEDAAVIIGAVRDVRAVRQEAADTSRRETRAAVKKALAYLAPPHTEGAIAAAVATLVSLRAALEGATERPLDVERLRQAMDDAEKLSLRLGSYVGLDLAVADLADAVVERYARLASPTTETPDA